MKRKHNKVADSDDDMDNLPLKYISSGQNKYISIKELRKYSVHACEFCERTFKNRYDYLIHNAKHIIIPLIKMLPYHCAECGLYCISEEEMSDHMLVKHKCYVRPKSLNSDDTEIKKLNTCNFEIDDISQESNEDEKPLNCLINKEKENNVIENDVTENILQNLVMNCKVDVEKYLPPCVHHSDVRDPKRRNVMDSLESNFNNHVAKLEPCTEAHNLIERDASFKKNIVESKTFAEEIDVKKSEVDNLKNFVSLSDPSSDFSGIDEDPIVILTPLKKEIVAEYNTEHSSIHFDDLIKPGIFNCKRCFKRFPNKYETIIHEIVHLNLSKAALETYKNKREKHSTNTTLQASTTASESVNHVSTCDICHEEITDKNQHGKTCHRLHCTSCGQSFSSRSALKAHEEGCNEDLVVNMCDNCLYMRERPKHVKYYGIMRFPKLGVKRICHWCGNLSEDISSVTLISRQRLADRIRFEEESFEKDVKVTEIRPMKTMDQLLDKQCRRRGQRGPGRGSKTLSNLERLKVIQNRLKLMKR